MTGKAWPALKSCKHQCYEPNDRLSRLPEDLLLLIMSFLTMKEVERTSVLSHSWNHLWRSFPVLIFKEYPEKKRTHTDYPSLPQERSNFVSWVNQVLEAHLGPSIDELKVIFDVDKSFQSDVDKWVVFARTKQVKRLELDFTNFFGGGNFSPPKWRKSIVQNHISDFKSCLHSLCLKFVNVTSKDVACLLRSFKVLENLYIRTSYCLRHIIAFDSPLQLKCLEVFYCPRLRTIDILAPKLISFTHYGKPIEMHLRNASLLSKVTIGERIVARDIVSNATKFLRKYFSQLEYLSWEIHLDSYSRRRGFEQCNLGINNPPVMTNLRYLELFVCPSSHQSLFGWADVIEASPLLQRLTIKFQVNQGEPFREIERRSGCLLRSLKTLELWGDVGVPIDLEFATYVCDNSIMLNDVIVWLRPLRHPLSEVISVDDQVANIRRIVPQGVNLTLKLLSEDFCFTTVGDDV